MKNIIAIVFCCVCFNLSYGQADAIDKYFSKYKEDDRFTMVHVSPKMFQMFAKVAKGTDDRDAQRVADVVKNLKGLKVLISEEDATSLYQEATGMINMSEYEELMTVRAKDEDVRFVVKDAQGGDIVKELLLLVRSDEFVMVSFVGDINLNEIGRLASDIDIDGLEHLDLLDKDKREKRNKH